VSDLAEFLLARAAEDEATNAGLAHHHFCPDNPCHCGLTARILRECEAKRRIVGLCMETLAVEIPGFPVDTAGFEEARSLASATLRALALPYADHPSFREEWRP